MFLPYKSTTYSDLEQQKKTKKGLTLKNTLKINKLDGLARMLPEPFKKI